ncbi:hypothetical protein Kurepalu1_00005 [Pseudomonas phage vB_PpuP-Kurepalu-1]
MTRASDLVSPGRLRNAQDVRRSLAWLISQAEIAVARGQSPEAAFADVKAFLASANTIVTTLAPNWALDAVAAPTSILANNTATSTITASVTRNGVDAPNGTIVTFSLSGPQAATCTLSASTANTASGDATVTVKGSAAGSVTVTASSNGVSDSVVVTLT